MHDRWAVALALAAAAGALRPSPVPVLLAAAVAAGALLVRQPLVLVLGAALLTSGLAHRSLAGLDGVVERAVAGEEGVLLSDPEPAAGGVRADVRLDGHRVELDARGTAAAALRDRLAGERVAVWGRLAPAERAPWLVVRHVAGRLAAGRIEPGRGPAAPAWAAANSVRRSLAYGADGLGPTRRSLFTGLVLGDDREQPAALTDDFRGAGLTHLLAVSGENVAFVLALLAPLGRRLRLWPRLGLTLAAVGWFALLTRFEPSVSRAAVMAAVAATTMTIGRPVARLRVLALAVTVLLVVDPLLVRALGFQLSVAAAAAITLLAPPLAGALPGPRWLAEPLGVTIAAQLGVAPLLLAAFGPVPVASLPANLLAVPAAGLVMVWGMTAGLVAGALGGRAGAVLHVPTRLLLDWIAAVARWTAAAPLGEVGAVGLAVGAAGLGGLVLLRRGSRLRWVAGVVAGGALAASVIGAQAPPPVRAALGPGVVRWHAAATDVVVLGGGSWRDRLGAEDVLAELRRAGVHTIDLLVLADDGVAAPVVTAVRDRHPVGAVLRPGEVPGGGAAFLVGGLDVTVRAAGPRLAVDARPRLG